MSDDQKAEPNPQVIKLRKNLEELGLSTLGNKKTLSRRLKAGKAVSSSSSSPQAAAEEVDATKTTTTTGLANSDRQTTTTNSRRKSSQQRQCAKEQHAYKYFLVFDVEATCEEASNFDFMNEIIEFPVVLVDGSSMKVIDEFHSYVRPTLNPVLSKFCTTLTGITQETVDKAPEFVTVLEAFEKWLSKYSTFPFKQSCIFVTDGPWDIRDFIRKQCVISKIPRPVYFYEWINIRKSFKDFYKMESINLNLMLERLHLTFEGREHSGIDDARNIARILNSLHKVGCPLRRNGWLNP